MTPEEIASTLKEVFEPAAIQAIFTPTEVLSSWQVDTATFRMLLLLSDDRSWLRVVLPIVSAEAAQPFLEQLLSANFDETLEVRYALHQGVVWGVFQHNLDTLVAGDFTSAIARLISLHQLGLSEVFNQLVESRMRQIIQLAKQQGQSLAATMQTLDRFYEEGILGDIAQGSESREQVLATWQRQLERFWLEVEP